MKFTGLLQGQIALRLEAHSMNWLWLCESQTVEKRQITNITENLLYSSSRWRVSVLTPNLAYYTAHYNFWNLYEVLIN